MKKFLLINFLLLTAFSTMAAITKVNEKLVRIFRETYPNAVQVSWTEYPDSYAVKFSEEGVNAVILYGKDGVFINATRYYKEELLPYYLVIAIRERFPEKKIYSVTEISAPYTINYYIKVEDEKTWMTIKVDTEGSISILEKFKKA